MGQREVLVLIPLLFALACTERERGDEAETVATVNGEVVSAKDLRLALEAEGRLASQALDDPTWQDTRKRQLLEGLIERKLLEQAGRGHGITPSEQAVDQALLRLRAAYPGDSFDQLLSQQRLSAADLRDRLRQQLLLEQLLSREVYARVAVTDQEIATWLEENPDFMAERPERVHASQIVVKTEEEARALRGELRRGAPFAELATKHSLSPDAKVGGDVGWFARGEMPPPFDEVCFRLAPGQISDVVESAYGFHIFLVHERERASKPAREERALEAEAVIRREKSIAAQGAFLRALREEASIQVNEKALAAVGNAR